LGAIDFIYQHSYFTLLLVTLNICLVRAVACKLGIRINKLYREAGAARNKRISLYRRCVLLVKQSVDKYEKKEIKAGMYTKAKEKMKKSGYMGNYAAASYLFIRYVITGILLVISIVAEFPQIKRSLALLTGMYIIIEIVVNTKKKNHNLKFQKNIYKIYKYLHNQVSSGVKVTDAIRTVYKIIEDNGLRKILIQLAARYELTLDIDTALEEFKSNFDAQEAETLCVALRQGIMTGDNSELLARQEEIMFKKYFNYIQAETDSCRLRGTIACALFTVVIVILIMVPVLNDVAAAVGKIFVN
jgi:Flp pilus assembly protein TadB